MRVKSTGDAGAQLADAMRQFPTGAYQHAE
jgi:hypothetical protein